MRRIAGVKRTDKRRIKELREEVGVKENFRRKLRKTEAEVGGLYEDIFGGSGRGVENESKGWGVGGETERDQYRRRYMGLYTVAASRCLRTRP